MDGSFIVDHTCPDHKESGIGIYSTIKLNHHDAPLTRPPFKVTQQKKAEEVLPQHLVPAGLWCIV
jgi:hypothetical protein